LSDFVFLAFEVELGRAGELLLLDGVALEADGVAKTSIEVFLHRSEFNSVVGAFRTS
jgi:hypothetical protein